MRAEPHNLHGNGAELCEVYPMPVVSRDDYWASVTDVPCPVDGCDHTVLWYEAGYVPGYRVCMRGLGGDEFDHGSIKHRFLAAGTAAEPVLIRDEEAE